MDVRFSADSGVAVVWALADVRDYRLEAAAFHLVSLAYLHVLAPALPEALRRGAGAPADGGMILVWVTNGPTSPTAWAAAGPSRAIHPVTVVAERPVCRCAERPELVSRGRQ